MKRGVVKIEGLREVQNALRQLPKATGRAAMRKVLREGGEPIARAARSLAPVASGELRESIDVSPTLSRSQRSGGGAKRTSKGWCRAAPSSVAMYVGPGQHPQAITQEFGTYKMPANPYMRPAWDAEKMNALDLIRDSLWARIDEAVARHARKLARQAARG